MKKTIKMMLCLTLIIASMASQALAETFTFSFVSNAQPANCTPTHTNGEFWNSGDNSGRMYVYHNVSCGARHTNLFKAYRRGSTYGSKWCRPGLNVPIQSNLIVKRESYGLWGRANTKYATENGITSFTAYGTYGWPQ